ncbi:hypothetical protein SDC9_205451 [bioreactor metagenome]|uniref:Uncharacterized protein n=1 Tax=bioreactor metagenome TaxID=1076179 RepID=A0A645J2Y0_9ZZZZ
MVRSGDLAALEQIGQLIAEMDRPPKQVLLEMKILEVTLDDGYRSVFDIGLAGKGTTAGPGGWASQGSKRLSMSSLIGERGISTRSSTINDMPQNQASPIK